MFAGSKRATNADIHRHTYRQRIRDTVIQIEPVTLEEVDQFIQRLERKRCWLLAAGEDVSSIDRLIIRLKHNRAILFDHQRQ